MLRTRGLKRFCNQYARAREADVPAANSGKQRADLILQVRNRRTHPPANRQSEVLPLLITAALSSYTDNKANQPDL